MTLSHTPLRHRLLGSAVAAALAGVVAFVAQADAAGGQAAAAPPAGIPGVTRRDLQRHDLSTPGREMIQAVVTLAPGATAPRHSHPGEEIIYILTGTLTYEIEGQATQTVGPGDVLFVPAGAIHSAHNPGHEPGAELATYIVEKGRPLLVPAE